MKAFKATMKPVKVDAILWTGKNKDEVERFLSDGGQAYCGYVKGQYVDIGTSIGPMVASIGDYIIRDVHGDCYPCKPDVFKKTYDF